MKYLITSITHPQNDKLKRILAEASFKDETTNGPISIKKGMLGGYVENDKNLSKTGTSWIHDDAIVEGESVISGDSQIFQNSHISGNVYYLNSILVNGNIHGNCHIKNSIIQESTIYGDVATKDACIVKSKLYVTNGNILQSNVLISTISAKNISLSNAHIISSTLTGKHALDGSSIKNSIIDCQSSTLLLSHITNAWINANTHMSNSNVSSCTINSDETTIKNTNIMNSQIYNVCTLQDSLISNVELQCAHILNAKIVSTNDIQTTNGCTVYKEKDGGISIYPENSENADIIYNIFNLNNN